MAKKNIFVMAMDDFHQAMLERLQGSEEMAFHPLLDMETAVNTTDYEMAELLHRARRTLKDFSGTVDAIVGYWDFPTLSLLPVLRREWDLPGPTLEAALRCEHKYWARVEEAQVAPRQTPRFSSVNPFDENVMDQPPLPYPFWIKPVRAHSSQLGFHVDNQQDFEHAIEQTRDRIQLFARPFNYILGMAELPQEIAAVDGWHCIAEEIVSAGRQCTLEGYVLNGKMDIYGVVDSLREGAVGSSFSRYQYPSDLPASIQEIMIEDCRRFVERTGFDNSPFNIEFFYNEEDGSIWMLEVNPRCSKSHSPLFEMVDGSSNLQAMVDVALGHRPAFPPEGGRYRCAAKIMLREHQNGVVERVPGADEVRAIEDDFPGCHIQVEAEQGCRLSDMLHQDSYSFEYAVLFVGGDSVEEIDHKADQIKARLDFRFTR
ncbi:D-alanine--D-alanine ligase [Marinobacter vulgaris]|uniref:D-alanine--D-alanine ligase n=1 Tax=Marinobacter vulgaris TaxID=1928331 RepID=A0A2V3ZKM0_9GAMM|nr:ATP-grasp domain-containing protein [Marinobacter vulgaris]PXX91043.1 D-alanine--D-alanine ligase [Marinobacter vulgaris]TSJ69973.1 ATP-grasp domain-containing protein [Marinobacter vulgaris]